MTKIGIDLGSRSVKVAVKRASGIDYVMHDTADFYRRFVSRKDGATMLDLSFIGDDATGAAIVATGYGRNLMDFANASIVSEIKAHYRGALETSGMKDFVLVDIGGQDSKVISVKDGYIDDFVMNDKCAASTGRFIENAGRILGMEIDEIAGCTTEPVSMTATCAIFSESEIIGMMAAGTASTSIAAGLNLSVAKRIAPMVRRYRPEVVLAAGGVAQSPALVHFLSELTGARVDVLPRPQFNGAIGCLSY